MKLWVLGILGAVVLMVGLPAVTLALADDPAQSVTTNGPGLGPMHDNPGHHHGWTKDRSRDKVGDSADTGRKGPPPWAHGHHAGPPAWSKGKHAGKD